MYFPTTSIEYGFHKEMARIVATVRTSKAPKIANLCFLLITFTSGRDVEKPPKKLDSWCRTHMAASTRLPNQYKAIR